MAKMWQYNDGLNPDTGEPRGLSYREAPRERPAHRDCKPFVVTYRNQHGETRTIRVMALDADMVRTLAHIDVSWYVEYDAQIDVLEVEEEA